MSQDRLLIRVSTSGPGLTISIKLDDDVLYQGDPMGHSIEASAMISRDEVKDHRVSIEMSGKSDRHTVLDDQGNIIQDLVLNLESVDIDGMDVTHLFCHASQYHHDFNGHGPATVEHLWGTMGCNGIATMDFTSPTYLWILENM